MFYAQKVDRRSRAAMESFLSHHFTYGGVFAHRAKLHHLGLPKPLEDKAWEVFTSDDDYWSKIWDPVRDFQESHGHAYTILNAGRSSGYLALHHSQSVWTEYRSYCRTCGQRNYRKVAPALPDDPLERAVATEILKNGGSWSDSAYLGQEAIRSLPNTDEEKLAAIRRLKPEWKEYSSTNRCGACGAEGEEGRVNYAKPPMHLQILGGVHREDPIEMDIDELRYTVDLVLSFDRTCDRVRDRFIDLLQHCEVREAVVMVPQTIRTLHCAC
ncbi:hypothetical protein A5904_14630 (plasmid) [Acidithiobacillus caldus]|uniref:Uncharacterized protein n=1 Tax=Acidithiobacillus caldus (strain SM-1) TaxID=990288 RepID=F9ZU54_ACICS|nr:hypothetical protein [Acidithiobacillus caldus]AEK59674.1 conserved hypothetical protein [Acidithiobacillus caldus SM-1]AUW34182.1 hypothetical protein A5904_14630 [Acidithiobacillus caldus]QER43362.1 hypothetical protein F0726_00273 [Acidithiobacillus caldus]